VQLHAALAQQHDQARASLQNRHSEGAAAPQPLFDFSKSQRAHTQSSGPAGSSSQLRNSFDFANMDAHASEIQLRDEADLQALRRA